MAYFAGTPEAMLELREKLRYDIPIDEGERADALYDFYNSR